MFPDFPTAIDGEEWLPLPRAPEYLISSEGRIWSKRSQRLLRPSTVIGGYLRTVIGGKSLAVHILVCETFHGPRPPGRQAAHLDGDSANPRRDNLTWATPTENAAHKRIHGTAPIGEHHPGAKLSTADVIELRRRWRDGESWRALARAFGVSPRAANDAGTGVTFAHVPDPCPRGDQPGARPSGLARVLATTKEWRVEAGRRGALAQLAAGPPPAAKLTSEQVALIKSRLLAGERQAGIAREYGLSRSTICGIANGRSWRGIDPPRPERPQPAG